MATWIFLIIIIAIVFWAISAYNTLIRMKGETQNAWKQIDVQLKRRHDLIPNLVATVKGAADFEKSTITEVTVELTATSDGTRMVLTHAGIPADSPGATGWSMALDKLVTHLANQ